MKEEMFLDTGKRFTSRGDQCGERELQRLGRERSKWSATSRAEGGLHRGPISLQSSA